MKAILPFALLLASSAAVAGPQNLDTNSDSALALITVTLAIGYAVDGRSDSFDTIAVPDAKVTGLDELDDGASSRPFGYQAMRLMMSKCQLTGFHSISSREVTMALNCINNSDVYADFHFDGKDPGMITSVVFGAAPKVNILNKVTDN